MTATPIFIAKFDSALVADYSRYGGNLTPTIVGSPSIVSNKCKFPGGAQAYLRFNAMGNFPLTNRFSIRFKYTPHFSGIPSTQQDLISQARNFSDGNWLTDIRHESENNIRATIQDDSVTKGITSSFTAVSGTEREFLLEVDGISGSYKNYIEGIQTGNVPTGTMDRDALGRVFLIGANYSLDSGHWPNYSIRDVVFYEGILFGSNYSPGYTLTVPNADTWPTEAQTKTGVTFYQSDVLKTGTYEGADRWSALAEADVRAGTAYQSNSLTNNKTGTLDNVTNNMELTDLEGLGPLTADLEEVTDD